MLTMHSMDNLNGCQGTAWILLQNGWLLRNISFQRANRCCIANGKGSLWTGLPKSLSPSRLLQSIYACSTTWSVKQLPLHNICSALVRNCSFSMEVPIPCLLISGEHSHSTIFSTCYTQFCSGQSIQTWRKWLVFQSVFSLSIDFNYTLIFLNIHF